MNSIMEMLYFSQCNVVRVRSRQVLAAIQHRHPFSPTTAEFYKVLLNIVRDLGPNFSSQSRRIRFWSKLKAARKGKTIQKFRDALQEAKTTLILALRPKWYATLRLKSVHLLEIWSNDMLTVTYLHLITLLQSR